MKYKDFKMLSTDDMKQILGGDAPLEPDSCSTTCGCGSASVTCALGELCQAESGVKVYCYVGSTITKIKACDSSTPCN
jgi:hypothetical protein